MARIAAPTSSPAKTKMSTIRMIRSRVAAARCCRSQASGTNMNGRTTATSSPAISTAMRGSPCGSGAIVVSVNVKVQSVRAFSFDGRAETSRACPRAGSRPRRSASARTAMARAPRSRSSDAPARSSGTLCCSRRRSPGGRHNRAPLLGTIGDVSLEGRDADRPPGCRQILADQLPAPWLRRPFRRRTRAGRRCRRAAPASRATAAERRRRVQRSRGASPPPPAPASRSTSAASVVTSAAIAAISREPAKREPGGTRAPARSRPAAPGGGLLDRLDDRRRSRRRSDRPATARSSVRPACAATARPTAGPG